jgi:hypothetical protein
MGNILTSQMEIYDVNCVFYFGGIILLEFYNNGDEYYSLSIKHNEYVGRIANTWEVPSGV